MDAEIANPGGGPRTSIIALINGGTAGFIWLYLVAWAGFMCVNTSMAEMGSMFVLVAPTLDPPILHTDSSTAGLLPREVNTTGSPNLHRDNTRNSSAS